MRSTFLAKPHEIQRNWYIVDATDVPLGRLSSVVATVLRGKNKPTFTPSVDTGDF
ncbi:uL13 family ribosomal protein, partial [Oenococcus oeni]